MVFRRIWGLGAAVATIFAAACDNGGVVTQTYFARNPDTVDNLLLHATMKGPMLVRVHGNPFGIDSAELEKAITDRMSRAIQRRVTKFTTDPAAAPRPEDRVVIAFGLPQGTNGKALCGPEGSVPAVEEITDTITVRAAFCHKGEMWTDVGGHMPTVESPTDKPFQTLITQVIYGLFPDPGSQRD